MKRKKCPWGTCPQTQKAPLGHDRHTLAIIKIPGHYKLDFLETKGNHLADTFARNAALNGASSSQTSVTGQKVISPNDNSEKLAKKAKQLASKREKQDWKFNNCFDKKRMLCSAQCSVMSWGLGRGARERSLRGRGFMYTYG